MGWKFLMFAREKSSDQIFKIVKLDVSKFGLKCSQFTRRRYPCAPVGVFSKDQALAGHSS